MMPSCNISASQNSAPEDSSLLECYAALSGKKLPMLRDLAVFDCPFWSI